MTLARVLPARLRAAAVMSALALTLAGCGGSAVSEPGAVASQSGSDLVPAATIAPEVATPVDPGTTVAEAEQPAAAQRDGTDTARAADSADTPSRTASNEAVDAKPRRARQQVEKVATGPAAAAASTVRNAPIFGGGRVCKPATLSEVSFGNVSTLSGVLGELFAPAVPALNTFMTSQNACGGLSGHKIKIVIKDDQGDPSTAVTRAQELIQKDRILAFVGNIQVLTLHAIVPTIKQAGIPIIGGDLTSSAWFENPLIFPQAASIQSFAVGYLTAIKNHFKKTVVGNLWCIEVPASCGAINVALKDLAPKFGIRIAAAPQVSLTQPSFVQECLQMKNAGVEAAVISTDAASAVRFARSCPQVGFFPETLIHQIGIGSEKQFLGNPWLGGTYIPLTPSPTWRTGPRPSGTTRPAFASSIRASTRAGPRAPPGQRARCSSRPQPTFRPRTRPRRICWTRSTSSGARTSPGWAA